MFRLCNVDHSILLPQTSHKVRATQLILHPPQSISFIGFVAEFYFYSVRVYNRVWISPFISLCENRRSCTTVEDGRERQYKCILRMQGVLDISPSN